MLFPMHFFEFRAYEQSALPPAAVNFHVIFFLCIWRQDTGGWLGPCSFVMYFANSDTPMVSAICKAILLSSALIGPEELKLKDTN